MDEEETVAKSRLSKSGPHRRMPKKQRSSWIQRHIPYYARCPDCSAYADTWGNWKLAVQALSHMSNIDITRLHFNSDGGVHMPVL